MIGLCVYCAEPAGGRAQNIGFCHHGLAAGIGMDDASACINQEHSSIERVETVGQCRGLDGLEIDHLAN
jgi:hypothetical protein